MFKIAALLAAAAAVVTADLPFKLGEPVLFGSGCPEGSVALVPSSDGKTLSVLFSEFNAATTRESNREYTSCMLAMNVDIPAGLSVAVTKVDYRGNVYVPNVAGSHADFSTEYFFAGQRNPVQKKVYGPGADTDLALTAEIASIAYSACGAKTNFRINAAVTAYRPSNSSQDVQIAIDSADAVQAAGFHYQFSTKPC